MKVKKWLGLSPHIVVNHLFEGFGGELKGFIVCRVIWRLVKVLLKDTIVVLGEIFSSGCIVACVICR